MKVFVVTDEYYNYSDSSWSVEGVFASEALALAFIEASHPDGGKYVEDPKYQGWDKAHGRPLDGSRCFEPRRGDGTGREMDCGSLYIRPFEVAEK